MILLNFCFIFVSMKAKQFTEEEIRLIVETYKTTNIGIESLALQFKTGKLKIKDILIKHEIPFKVKGNLNTGSTKSEDAKNKYKNKVLPKEGYTFLAICKKTGKEFKDYLNQSGALSEHIIENYGVEVPNNFFKKKYFLENNKYWHEQYFDLVEVEIRTKRKCKYCDWGTYDLENKTGCYENHLLKEHNVDLKTFLNDFPDEIKYHNTHILKQDKENFLDGIDNSVLCAICGKKLKFINNKHLKKHNITNQEYKEKYNNETCSVSTKKYSKNTWEKHLKLRPHNFTSVPQLAIQNLIQSYGFEVLINNKKLLNGTELDIYVPQLKLGIEYNGNYWHSEKTGGKGSTFHINKTKLANNHGIRLIHIFEDEWLLKNDIVISKLKHIIGKSETIKVGARKCEIKEISQVISSEFYENFHLQGTVSNIKQINIGAFYNDNLVALMSFSDKRNMTKSKTKNYDYELIRFATHADYSISGIASKLLKHFILNYNPNSIISFADRRWSDVNNNVYLNMNFKEDGFTRPNYWYYKGSSHSHTRHHKFGFGINALKRKNMYITGLSEWECMQYHGWDRIWDCGLIRYVWQKPEN